MRGFIASAAFVATFIAFIAVLTSIDLDTREFPLGVTVVFAIVLIFVMIGASRFMSEKAVDVYDNTKEAAKKHAEETKGREEVRRLVAPAMQEYQDAARKYRYLSDETLLAEYEPYVSGRKEDMQRLALEEQLVERGLIPYSPMHEKLNALGKHFSADS